MFSVGFSKDSKSIISGSYDKTVKVWENDATYWKGKMIHLERKYRKEVENLNKNAPKNKEKTRKVFWEVSKEITRVEKKISSDISNFDKKITSLDMKISGFQNKIVELDSRMEGFVKVFNKDN